jgi:hypothetical protein
MAFNRARRNPIFASDVRQLGGVVSVHTDRNHSDAELFFASVTSVAVVT